VPGTNPFTHTWETLRSAVADLADEDVARPSGCAGWLAATWCVTW